MEMGTPSPYELCHGKHSFHMKKKKKKEQKEAEADKEQEEAEDEGEEDQEEAEEAEEDKEEDKEEEEVVGWQITSDSSTLFITALHNTLWYTVVWAAEFIYSKAVCRKCPDLYILFSLFALFSFLLKFASELLDLANVSRHPCSKDPEDLEDPEFL